MFSSIVIIPVVKVLRHTLSVTLRLAGASLDAP